MKEGKSSIPVPCNCFNLLTDKEGRKGSQKEWLKVESGLLFQKVETKIVALLLMRKMLTWLLLGIAMDSFSLLLISIHT